VAALDKAQSADVSVVIPGRNCGSTLRACLRALQTVARRPTARVRELLFVDDGSTDDSAAIAKAEGTRVVQGQGRGPGAARNLGWRAARGELIWFVDADCVVAEGALEVLLAHFEDEQVAAVSGAYDNGCPDSLVARLIHEEIALRHRAMHGDVDFLATFSVVYRRDVLTQLNGFDERYLKGQDAELSFRATNAGYRLRFDNASRAAHFHERRLWPYLQTQRKQGYWRAYLHLEHGGHAGGDSYSRLSDHLQPPCALIAIAATLVVAVWPELWGWCVAAYASLVVLQAPLVIRLQPTTGLSLALGVGGLSWLRSFWRGVGLAHGTLSKLLRRKSGAAL